MSDSQGSNCSLNLENFGADTLASYTYMIQDIYEFSALENLEVLDLTSCGCYGTLQMQGSERVSILKKLKVLNLGSNQFNKTLITSLSALPSLKALDISYNNLYRSFPSQGCKSLTRLERLESISLAYNNFNKLIISCLRFFPSLKNLDLGGSLNLGRSFPMQGINLLHLNLDLNHFNNDIMGSMAAFQSLRFLSLQGSGVRGRLFANEVPKLPHLEVLLLGNNNFNGTIPMEGILPPSLIDNLTFLEYLDFSHNKFEGMSCYRNPNTMWIDMSGNRIIGLIPSRISNSTLSEFVVRSNMLRVEVRFTTKSLSLTYNGGVLDIMSGLDLSCNKLTGYFPKELGLLTHIRVLNLSHNLLTGPIPLNLSNLTKIESLNLSSNSFTGKVPSELVRLNSLASFNVSYNNLSGRLSEMKAHFSTFTKESYEGNSLLCGPPLEIKCTIKAPVIHPSIHQMKKERMRSGMIWI
ncbi:hypothetical protein L1987_47969 [Smallanthus sonchifolius]|uniref:Uncharacterized protein n=1 Tax=Smallanthus sonchifolius TaxID=185202 RepID=A0ACB9FRJ4_9ASTR|nr:hypothetical protein L1987_47969 [Smallanthus sonchifolius]